VNNILSYKGYYTKVGFDSEDCILYGKIEGINDFVDFYCESVNEIKVEFEKAVDDYLEFCKENGKTPEKPFKGSFNVRVSQEIHREAFLKANFQNKKLNQFVTEAIEEKIARCNESINTSSNRTEMTLELNKRIEGESNIIYTKPEMWGMKNVRTN
jgi:putative hif-contiguous protein B